MALAAGGVACLDPWWQSVASTSSVAIGARQTFVPSFYLVMTLVMAFFVFAGFGMTYWVPLARGTYGIAHATAVLFMGALISLLGMTTLDEQPAGSPLDTLYLSFTAILGFGLLFTLSIRNVRNPDVHKRLMLFAMLPILPPGVNRFFMVPLGVDVVPVVPLYLTLNAMSLAILIHEFRKNRRIAGTSMIGAGYLLLQTVLHVPMSSSLTLLRFGESLASLVYYR